MSSAKECIKCIDKQGIDAGRCDECRPVVTKPQALPSVKGCEGICCTCIERHDGNMEALPCQTYKNK